MVTAHKAVKVCASPLSFAHVPRTAPSSPEVGEVASPRVMSGIGVAIVADSHLVSEIATVLLVDDDPVILRCHVRCLNDEFLIETSSNGVDAHRRVVEGRIDVVVSDVSMPEMTGFELLRAIHELDPFLPVILASAGSAIDGANTGCVEAFVYLTKPVDGAMFRAAVRLAVQYRRSPRTDPPRSSPSKRPSATPRSIRPSERSPA